MTEAAIKILCVEDEEDIRRDVAEELRDAGYMTIEAQDGKDGLDAIIKHEPDLVVSDMTMPRMDGQELLRKLREEHPEQAELPFIFLTAMSDREHILEGKRLGADDYLTKPIDFDLLLATVGARLQQVQRMKARKEEQMVKLYQSMSGGAAKACEPAAQPKQEPAKDVDAKSRIGALAATNGTVVAGRLQMVGLDEIEATLGEQWPKHAERVARIAETTIQRRLSPDDVFEVAEDNRYLICFGSLNEQEAAFKAQSIAREIQEQILGTDGVSPALKESLNLTSEAHEIPLTAAEAAESDSVFDLITARLDQAAQSARESEKQILARLVNECSIVPIRVATTDGKDAPISFAEFDMATRKELKTLRAARPDDESLVADLDALRLGRSSELLCEGAADNQSVLFVTVNFSTIHSQPLLERYLKLCATLPDTVKSRLALNLAGIPEGHPLARIEFVVHALRRNCRFVTLALENVLLGSVDPAALQLSILTSDYQNVGQKATKQPGGFRQVMSSLLKKKTRLLVHDVPSQNEADHLLGLGVGFVALRP